MNININCSELDNIDISFEFFTLIKQVAEELIKYLYNFRQLTLEYTKKLQMFETNFGKKLSKPPENPKISQIIELTSKVTEIVFQNIELFQSSTNELEESLKEFENFLKQKTETINNIKKSSLDLSKNLINSYNEVNKTKNAFINSLSKTEEIIDKYYIDKNKIQEHESGLGRKLSENEYNILKEQQKNQLNEMNNSIKLSKKYEEFHKGSIASCSKNQDKFKEECNSYADKIKLNICEFAEEIKKLICVFMLSYKNMYKQPLALIDICINKFNSLEESKEMDKIITSNFKNDNSLQYIQPTKYHLKSFSHLKNSNYLKNEDDNNEETNKIKDVNINDLKRKAVLNLEDGFEEMRYISDESLIMTIKSLFDNFDLIEKEDLDIQFEERKNRTQKYILKIISNMNSYPFAKEGLYTNENYEILQDYEYTIDYKREELTNEEIMDLIELLDVHENRIIFLQKLSDYRGLGKFVLCDKDYILLSQLFNIICDKIKKDSDYHAAEMVIILSETYFIEEKKKKKFLQESFKENRIFKDKNFWEEFLCYSINKEIMKTLKIDKKIKEDKENSDYKFSNVVFSQILTLIDNMFEFNLDPEIITEVLNPKISVYKLNDEFKQTIKDVIEVKKNIK